MPAQDQSSRQAALALRTRRRRDDTARFLDRFEKLTGIRVQSTSVESLPEAFLSRKVDPPDQLVRRLGEALEPRTLNALRRFEPGRPEEPWTFLRLLGIRGFGVFSLLDLLEVEARYRAKNPGQATE